MTALKPETLTSYRFLSAVKLSPDGRQAAFIVKEANWDENRYRSNLWLYRLDDEQLVQLTASDKDLDYVWSVDGRHLLFLSKRGKDDEDEGEETTVFKIGINGGEAVPAFTIEKEVSSIRLVDEKRILFTASDDLRREPRPPEDAPHSDHQAWEEHQKEEKDYHVLDEIPYWFNGEGYTNKKRKHLYLYNMTTQETTALTEGLFNLEAFDLWGEQVVMVGQVFENKAAVTNDLYLVALGGGELEKLTDGTRSLGQPRFLTAGMVVVPGNDMQRYGLEQNHELYAFHLEDRRLENLTPGMDKSIGNSVVGDSSLGAAESSQADGERYCFQTTEDDSCFLNRLTPDGRVERIIGLPGTVESFDVRGDVIVYVAFRGNQPAELCRWQDGREVRLTHLNEPALADVALATPDHFAVDRGNGVTVDAWIMRPAGMEPGKKYPAVLEIHGGPKAASSHIFFHEYQLLASRGYAVIYSNPRGSDGKGDEFADIRGRYGTIDYEDLMAVVDEALARYDFIDPGRLGVTGGSYGGYMTNWIIGHTDRFKAAVSQRSISNWVCFGYTTDIGYYFLPDQMGANPWEDMDKVWWHSPLRYADQVKTPTLFIHSAQDYRCWLPEGLQMFSALRYHGVESRLVVFEGENHELSRGGKPKHRVRRLNEILDWFDGHLK
jgi:dipeptidyl aminopeptidase/acylaminoacyl peptidase